MLFRIDPSSAVPLFAQLAGSVRGALARGELSEGDRLPAAREVATALDINIHTVLRAYQELRDEGAVELRRGRGAVITAQAGTRIDIAPAVRDLVTAARKAGIGREALVSLIREEYPS